MKPIITELDPDTGDEGGWSWKPTGSSPNKNLTGGW